MNNYNWVYNFEDKFVHAVKKKQKDSDCGITIERGITMNANDIDAEKLKKFCPECILFYQCVKVLEL